MEFVESFWQNANDLCYFQCQMTGNLLDTLSLDLPAFIIGIGFHEFCHAFAADRLGDPGPREQGRVSLNPIQHLDFIGTALPLYLSAVGSPVAFGWGKPVIVDPSRFKNPVSGFGIVAIAGPLGNLLICLLTGLFINFSFGNAYLLQQMTNPTVNFLYRMLFKIFALNLGLLIFNLIPVPPLDGSKVLVWLGGPPARAFMDRIQPHGLLILMVILMTNLDSYFITPLFLMATKIITGAMWRYVLVPSEFIQDFL